MGAAARLDILARLHVHIERRTSTYLLAGTALLAVLHTWITSDVPGPTIFDETGYLGNARWLSGDPRIWHMGYAPYYGFGWSLVVAPLFWFIDQPDRLFRAVQLVNAVLAASLLPLLFLLCRRVLSARPAVALAAAAVGASVPAVTFNAGHALTENLVLPLVVATALASWLLCTPRPWWQRIWLAPGAVLLYASHARFVVLLPLVVLLLLTGAWVRLVPVRLAAANATLGLVGTAAVLLLRRALIADRWSGIERPEGDWSDLANLLGAPADLRQLGMAAAGQLWYLTAGSLGLAVVGLLFVARRTGRPRLRQGRPGPALRQWLADPRTLPLLFLLVAGAGVFAVSSVFFYRNLYRPDQLVYGRHNESFFPLWTAAGAVFLLVERRRAHLAAAVLVAALLGLTVTALLTGESRELLSGGYHVFSIPAIGGLGTDDAATLVPRASAVALVGLALTVGVGVTTRRPALVLPVCAVLFLAAGAWTLRDNSDVGRLGYSHVRMPEELAERNIDAVAMDLDVNRDTLFRATQFFRPDLRVEPYRSFLGERPGEPFVLSTVSSQPMREAGARMLYIDAGGFAVLANPDRDIALWVLPGEDHDRLAAEGQLLPRSFPGPLDASSRESELRLAKPPPDGILRASPGGTIFLGVRGRHTGEGSPWPAADMYNRGERVQVGVRLQPLGRRAPTGTNVFGRELPRTLYPGERFASTLIFRAAGADATPLREGRYEVAVFLRQADRPFSPRGEEPIRFVLDVTGG
ncbi:MAG: hypothetical protein H0U26_02725 [Acidimicrobiia bacterium]|nr:hypothetical protein [Acidimicrobiia bacterium]